MSDYFFYDMNKKMADLAKRQQLAEDAHAASVKPAPSALRTQLNERDMGKHNNATTGFAALAKKTNPKIAGAQLAKMRAKGQVEESKKECPPMSHIKKMCQDGKSLAEICKMHSDCDQTKLKQMVADCKKKLSEGSKPDFLDLDKDGNRKEPMKSAARSAKKRLREEGDAESLLAKYSPDMHGRIKNATDDELYSMAQGFGGDQHSRVDHELNMLHKVRHHLSGPEGAGARRVKGVQDRFDKVMHRKTYPVKEDSDAESLLAKYSPDMHDRIKNATDDELYGMAQGFGGDQHSRVDHELDQLHKARHHLSGPEGAGARRVKGVQDRFDKVMHRKTPRPDYGTNLYGRKIHEADATPQDVGSYEDEVKKVNAPQRKASAPVPPPKKTMPPKPKMYPPQAIDEPVSEAGRSMSPKQKKFAALAKPFDKITFADKIVGAKKEVDEMLGDVAASAMKKAVRGRNRDMEEASDWSKLHEPFKAGDFDDTPTRRRSSSGGEIDTSKPGSTIHRPVKGNYSGAGHDAGADDEPSGQIGRRKVGAGMGKKIGAKINRGTSKLMTDEGDMPEDMIQPQDSGEYDQEGDMAKNDIHTMVRHAQDLEKMLSDNENLPEWVQKKINLASDYIQTAADYLASEKEKNGSNDMEMDEERTGKRDNRAERAGRKVAKDIEYDEKKKDGIHGKRRGSEDSRAERAGKKVTKDIEYDEKKDKKKKEVDETTSSGSVATGAAPKSSGGHSYGKGIYDSLNRQLENMISESMNINMSMNNDEHGGPRQSLTVTATDEDAVMLAGLLKMAGLGHGDEHIHAMTGDDSDMDALHSMDHMHGDEPCADCGQTECECDGMMETLATNPDGSIKLTDIDPDEEDDMYDPDQSDAETARLGRHEHSANMYHSPEKWDYAQPEEMDEAYGDTDETKNHPDYPTDQVGTDDAMMYSGGLNDKKRTGQTTVPVIAGQHDRMGSDGDHELRRMMEIAGLR